MLLIHKPFHIKQLLNKMQIQFLEEELEPSFYLSLMFNKNSSQNITFSSSDQNNPPTMGENQPHIADFLIEMLHFNLTLSMKFREQLILE